MATLDTVATRPDGNSHADGKAYFETSTNKFIVWDATGGEWIQLDSDGTGAVPFENRWSASFDGTSDYFSVTESSSINISGDITLSAWVNRSIIGTYNAVFTKRQVGGSMNYQLTINNSNGQVGLGHSGGAWVYNTTTALATGTWYHVAVTVSGSTAQFYVNGVPEDSFTGISINATTHDLIIGATVGYNYFGGNIDEAAIFNSALSASNISSIYNSGIPAAISSLNPVGWWRMGDDSNDSATSGGSIATITDSSGNGNHATQGTAASQPTFADLTGETIYV